MNLNSGTSTITQNNGAKRADLQTIFSSSFEINDLENNPKAKLYELFVLIEKEFEAIYAENYALRQRLESTGKLPTDQSNIGEVTPVLNVANIRTGNDYKVYSKKPQSSRQKWKTAFSGPSGRLVTSLKVGSVNLDTSKHRFVQNFCGHSDGIWNLSTVNVGSTQIIASASADHTAKVWLSEDARCLANYVGHTGSVNSVSIRNSFDNFNQIMVLTTSGDRQSHIWKTSLAQLNSETVGQSNDNEDDFSGATLTHSLDYECEEDQQQHIGLSSTNSNGFNSTQIVHQPLLRLSGHNDVVISGEWILGGNQLITASWDRTANVYDTETGKVTNILSGHDKELTHCSAHTSQKLLATASKDFTFRLWDFREQIPSVAVFQGHNDIVSSVVFTSTHHIISGSDDRTVKMWDLRNMKSPTSMIRVNSSVNTLSVCNEYNLIAIPQDSRHISICDLNSLRINRLPRTNGKCHHRMVCCAAWLTNNPKNNLITSGFDKQIIGWKVQYPTKS